MGFQLYEKSTGRPGNYHTEPVITLGKAGDLRINDAAARKFNLLDVSFVELFYDNVTGQIALRPLQRSTKYSLMLKRADARSRTNMTKRIGLRGFAKQVELQGFGECISWDAAWDNETQMIVLTRAEA